MSADGDASAFALTPAQLADLGVLLAEQINRGTLQHLGAKVLSEAEMGSLGNDVLTASTLSPALLKRLEASGKLEPFVALLRLTSADHPNLLPKLDHILRGGNLAALEAQQALAHARQPFFKSATFETWYPVLTRTVCAIGAKVSPGRAELLGTGFLVGPDLVMTNHHVVEPCLTFQGDAFAERPGSEVYCFFDYFWQPSPTVPPVQDGDGCLPVKAADKWLEHTRRNSAHEGFDKDIPAEELDYAVIRLSRPVGRLPTSLGGGATRGWLALPDPKDPQAPRPNYGPANQRLFVFGHPSALPQGWDVGDFDALVSGQTRCWYRVSASHGSSGGPTVDCEGRLFALHNAEAQGAPAGAKLNQGVRIDLIADDLWAAGVKDWPPGDPNAGGPPDYWSLTDSMADPRPILGRRRFREAILRLDDPKSLQRVAMVTGPEGSGRRFSAALLQRMLSPRIPVVLSPRVLAKTPWEVVAILANELNLPNKKLVPVPVPKETEDFPRWIRMDLLPWLRDRLAEAKDQVRFPAWVVVDTVLPNDDRMVWDPRTRDLLAAMVGVRDQGQPLIELPELRWLYLGPSNESLLPPNVDRFEEDLGALGEDGAETFAQCALLAWRSVDKKTQIPDEILKGMWESFDDPRRSRAVNFIRSTLGATKL